ncbi:MAG: type II toxin-antitoxin system Phd/YefM family antitoxin [Pirellulaceae bacterium]
MKIVSVADMKSHLSSYLKDSEQGPVVVTRNGRPVAVLLGVTDEDELERLVLAYSPKLRGILDAARERIREGEGIRHEEFWEDVESASKRKKGTRRRGTSA